MLIAEKDLNEVFAQYHPELDECGNRVYWVQVIGNRNNAYPVTNVHTDKSGTWTETVFYKYIGGLHIFQYLVLYNVTWRLFDFPPTKEELALPWWING